MSEHLRESMIGELITCWCPICKADTPHRVDRVAIGSHAGKKGQCQNAHRGYLTKEQETRRWKEKQQRLPL